MMSASRIRPRAAASRRALLVVLAVVALTLAACGGRSALRAGSTPTPSGTGTPNATRTSPLPAVTARPPSFGATTGPDAKLPSSSPRPRATASGGGSTASLDKTCVRRGVDTQGITIRTKPKGPAGYNTLYSDGSHAADGTSNYRTGYGGGFADDSGTWRQTWVVADNAPTGIAVVRAVSQDGPMDLSFRIVAQNQSCS